MTNQERLALIRQENSVSRKELQAVDVIAWAFFQKYEHGDSQFYDVISPKVVTEDLVAKANWAREK